ncbi:GDP-mannose 4,6-dehydratase [Alkalinema sp. FACHB-956]|uniref:GDP-mannose 4,6-dehydratase n=1 Tax=Alkalinema sp. FACHB-956 TaxID=2692768 RepID=UPI001688C2F1|nr:GDP-mannose 4,6-dehydratase [Alkalinema sp. FACHB-956]MBD2327819.1 GDP-mannose 4,6-dehydratase [Alkalinema sp. FACHB-956]
MENFSWTGKQVLVTGAGGFIGSHLCEALVEAGAEVTAMIHYSSRSDWGNLEFLPQDYKKSLQVVSGNIEDSDFVMRQVKGKAIVFHLAALIGIPYSYVAPRSYLKTNIEGTLNVVEAARHFDLERIVHTSTSETYGTAIYTPIDEQHPLQGQSPYSASKIAADKMAESYYLAFGLPVSTIRPFNTYGPRQSARAVIPTIISQAFTQPSIRLGSLDPVRDLNFVKDTVSGFIKVAESESCIGQVTNVGYGKGITIGELAHTILSLMGVDKPIEADQARVRPSNSEVFTLICNNSKAAEIANWQPQYSLEQGLQATIDFVQANLNFFKTDQYSV